MEDSFKVSIIIPCQNDKKYLSKSINAIYKQTVLPKEIIIVDSSKNNEIKQYIHKLNSKNNIKIIYKRIVKSYAGRSTNYGFNFVSNNYVALLDTKTIPKLNWIEISKAKFSEKNVDIVFGTTKFIPITKFQKIVQSISYGNTHHETVPGTIFKSHLLNNKYIKFNEIVRSGYDIEWKENLKNNFSYFTHEINVIDYFSLSKNIIDLYRRYIIYSFHSARIEIQRSLKSLYLSIFFVLISFLIPRWNLLISGWENNPFYIPYVSRIYLLSLSLIFLSYSFFYFFYKKRIFKLPNIFLSTFKIFLIFSLCYGLNKTLLYDASLNVKNIDFITNVILGFLILISLLIRGVILPLTRKITLNYLFPFNFVLIAFLGLSIDILKSPFYIFGAILGLFNLYKSNEKDLLDINKFNLIFYTKYSSNSASIRYRFDAYEYILKKNNYNIIRQPLFNDIFFKNKIFNNKINFLILINSYFLRLLDILTRKKPFIAIIHIELLPFMSVIGEFILKLRGIPYIIDIDDAVYHRFDDSSKLLQKIINFKFKTIIGLSSGFFAGNDYHINYFRNYSKNSIYLPTVINAKRYFKSRNNNKYNKITLVWIGTPSTSIYLNIIREVLISLKTKFNIQINLIGMGKNKIKNLDYNNIEWNEDIEINLLSRSHIGIMPLKNDNWSLGKCGFKILQYMGSGIPVVASPVGVNNIIINDGVNGFLAKNNKEWMDKLTILIENENLRDKFSKIGYQTVFNDFNIENVEKKYLSAINSIKNNVLKKKNIEIINEKNAI